MTSVNYNKCVIEYWHLDKKKNLFSKFDRPVDLNLILDI